MAEKLTALLSGLLRQAEAQPGQKHSRRLPNNLSVDVKLDGGETWLQIHRSSVYPSRAEWTTVLKHWPYPIMAEPSEVERLGRRYLLAHWPTQRRLGLPEGETDAKNQNPA